MKPVSCAVGALRILVVEDEPTTRNALCQLLQMSGYACVGAAQGAEALELTQSFHPEVIIMDLMMPVLDGFETTRRLKAAQATRGIPVLALTSSVGREERAQAAQAGFDDFLAKPVDFPELLSRLRLRLAKSTRAG